MPPRRPGGVTVRSPSPPGADTDRRLNPYRDSALRRRSRSPDAVRPYRAAADVVRRRSRSPERRDYSGRFADEQYRRRYISEGVPQDSYAYREAAIAREPSGLGDRGVLLRKSLNLEDGSFRTFYSLPSESGRLKGDSAMVESGKYGGVYTSAVSAAHGDASSDRLYPSKVPAREPFDGGRSSYNFKGCSYPTIPSSSGPTKGGFGSLSATLPKDGFVGSYASGTYGASDSKYKSSLDGDGYARQPAYDYGNGFSLKDSHRYDGVSRDPARDVSYRDGTYLELSKRISTTSGFEPNVLDQRLNTSESHYRRMPAGSDLSSSVGVRSSGLRNENLGKPYGSLRESTLGALGVPRGDYDDNKYHDLERPPYVKEEAGFSKYMESGSSVSDFRSRISRADDVSYYEGDNGYARNESSMTDYGRRVNNPSELGYHTSLYENRGDQPSSLHEFRVNDDSYDSRILRGHLPDEIGRHDRRFPLPLRPGALKASEELNNEDDEWDNHDLTELLPEKRTIFARNNRLQRTTFPQSQPMSDDEWVPDEGSLREYFSYDAQDIRKKKRVFKPGRLYFPRKPSFDRKKDFHKPGRHRKVAIEERLNMDHKPDEDPEEGPVPIVKREPVDPLEGSDEFKQLVHKAFLRFSKQLNEETAQQRKYMEQGKGGALLCCVCGRDSKEFGDMHNLIAHTFNSYKGLRSDHLGLHKALCAMMGWNSLIPPDMSKKYQVMVAAEAADLKEDLIIWPAVVILHNSSIGIKNSKYQEVVTNERMEKILGEMGFDGGKAKVCRGKPANHSILLVKFMPTFSGLQEAERLHKYLDEKKRGRKEWLQSAIGGKQIDTKVVGDDVDGWGKVEKLFYGYLAIAEDLIKLDFESKKRSVVKSKREIAAIADASVNGERLA